MADLTFSSTQNHQRFQRRRVRILSTNIEKKQSLARDQQGGSIVIDLSATVGPILIYPTHGEEWFVINIADNWVLDRLTDFQNAAYTIESSPGDWVINNPRGKIRILDKDGPVGSSGTATFSRVLNRKIRVGTTIKVVEVIESETGKLLGYLPILK